MNSGSLLSKKQRLGVGPFFVDVRRSLGCDGSPVIVLLHGIGVSGTYFLPFAELLAKDYDVRVLDLPGYGQAPRPDHALSLTELADVTAEYLTATNVTEAIIIGHSMGCQIAAQLVKRHPAVCQKLILIGPTINKWEQNLFMQGVRLLQAAIREPLKLNTIILQDYLRMGMLRYLKTARYMIRDQIEEQLRECTVPTLIVRGTEDKIAPKEWTDYLANCMQLATAVDIANAPHDVQWVRSRELLARCEDFLRQ